MKSRKIGKMIGVGVAAALVALATALAMADPGRDAGVDADPIEQRATRAAQALADAHQGNQAIAITSDVAQREIAARDAGTDEILQGFSARAEEHLIATNRHPSEALQLLGTLVQQLRGTGGAPATDESVVLDQGNELSVVGQDGVVEQGRTVEKASVVWGDLTVRGHVLGDAVAVNGDVIVEPGARVDGDVVSVGGRVEVSEGAWVSGDRTQVGPGTWSRGLPFASNTDSEGSSLFRRLKSVFDTIVISIVMGFLALLTAALFPSRVRNVISTLKTRPGMSLISGILALVVTATASSLLVITCIGAPVAVILLIIAGAAAMVGLTGAATLIGEAMPGKMKSSRTAMRCLIIGFIVFTVAALIPLGGILLGLALSFGLGATVLSRFGSVPPAA